MCGSTFRITGQCVREASLVPISSLWLITVSAALAFPSYRFGNLRNPLVPYHRERIYPWSKRVLLVQIPREIVFRIREGAT